MKILLAFDGSEGAKLALKFTLKFKEVIENITVLYVTPAVMGSGPTFDSYVPSTVYIKQDEAADKILQISSAMLSDSGINFDIEKMDATGDQIAKVIVRAAEEKSCDMIVSGTRKLSGLSKVGYTHNYKFSLMKCEFGFNGVPRLYQNYPFIRNP